MALGLVGQIIRNKNKNKNKNWFQKNPWRSVYETHRQRARQDQIPAYFTQSVPQRLNSVRLFLTLGGVNMFPQCHLLRISLQKISQPSKGEFLLEIKIII